MEDCALNSFFLYLVNPSSIPPLSLFLTHFESECASFTEPQGAEALQGERGHACEHSESVGREGR